MGTKRGSKLPTGISVRKWKSGGETIYISFTYQGVNCSEPESGRPADTSNIQWASNKRGEILNKIRAGTFVYADYYPNSKKLKLFGHQRSNAKLSHYLDQYYEHAKARGLKASSLATYHSRKETLKDLIGAISPKIIDLAYIRDLSIRLHNEEQMSYTTITHTFKVLRGALDEVVIDKTLPNNPLHGFQLGKYVAPPKKKKRGEETIAPFLRSELQALLAACKNEHERLLLQIWVATGLRTGELCALRWSDVNTRRKRIHIEENYVSMVHETGTPKTGNGERDIDLDDATLDLFQQQRRITGLEFDLVFINTNTNGQYDSYSLRRWFVRICKKAGVRYRYAYNLRHTFATIKISQGINTWELANMMGHASPKTIYDHYGAFIKDYEDDGEIFSQRYG